MKLWRLMLIVAILAFPTVLRTQSPSSGSMLQILGALDAAQGETVFRAKGCFDCHSYDDVGGTFGPDLGPNRIRGTSPSALAAAMWNHAPSMWQSMQGVVPVINSNEAAALYSFLYSRLYFNPYPDAQHGAYYFEAHCASCHDRARGAQAKAGPPASTWGSLEDPIVLAGRMWNHSTAMLDRMNRDFKSWPRMTGQDVTDVLEYLWRSPEVLLEESRLRFGNDRTGEELFEARCSECHVIGPTGGGRIDLSRRLRRKTLPDVAASMWNHAPAMKRSKPDMEIPVFTDMEMRDLLTYLVFRPALYETGNAEKGAQVFQRKNCAECHEGHLANTAAPPLSSFKGSFDAVRITTVLWSHGPTMLAKMKEARIPWPRFKESEMLDLLTYLNSKAK